MALAVLLLVPVVSTSVLAAEASYDLYDFIASNCYSNQTLATDLLAAEALVDGGSITISYPESDLLSVSGGKLIAATHPSGLNDANWVADNYTINNITESFNGATSVALDITGTFHVDVSYLLNTGISSETLNLPAVLASEAATQITVLNHLISYDKPYMTYMEQMSDSQMETLYEVLDPSFPFASRITLNDDATKNLALKNSFRAVIANMRNNCYLDDGTLTLFDLLLDYEDKGLRHYYQNSDSYLTELNLLSQYLTELLAADEEQGLTEEDKITAIDAMITLAADLGFFDDESTLDFVDLRDTINTASDMLVPPNDAINCDTTNKKMKALVAILEEESVEEGSVNDETGMVEWNSLISPYGDTLILSETVGTDLENVANVAAVGNTEYATLDEALSAASATGDTVILLKDLEITSAFIPKGVTLNLGAFTLTADYLIGLKGSYLTATPNAGKLIIDQDDLFLSAEGYKNEKGQYILPIWDPDQGCYLFSLFVLNTDSAKDRGLTIDEESEQIYFQFKHQATGSINQSLLADDNGANDNALKVIVRLVWTNENGKARQDFVYNAGFVQKVAGSFDYTFTLNGYSTMNIDLSTLEVTAMIITDSGATASSAVWSAADLIG